MSEALSTLFLHLSDIHFIRSYSGGAYDLEADLRRELELDVARLHSDLGPFRGILVSGDVAYAGKKEEYQTAHEWLERLCQVAGCPTHRVWTVPGNHDVDRDVARRSHPLRRAREAIRRAGPAGLDNEIANWVQDREFGAALLTPLSNYNEFAKRYGCEIRQGALAWDDDLELNDGLVLRIRGITSALISDELDNDGDHRLAAGSLQFAVPRGEPNVQYLVMCHHPPEWLFDRDIAEDYLRRAKIQLFGHKHRQRLNVINDGLRIASGAVHPSRSETNWNPRFNALRVVAVQSSGDWRMRVEVYPRVWNEERTEFIPEVEDGSSVRRFEFPLPGWQPVAPASANSDTASTAVDPPSGAEPEHLGVSQTARRGDLVDARRRLTYRFMELPYLARLDIARDLVLVQEEDADASGDELIRRVFRRAREQKKLEALWDAVEKRYEDPAKENPFVGH